MFIAFLAAAQSNTDAVQGAQDMPRRLMYTNKQGSRFGPTERKRGRWVHAISRHRPILVEEGIALKETGSQATTISR